MIIDKSYVSLSGASSSKATVSREESLRAWVDDPVSGRRVSVEMRDASIASDERTSAETLEGASARLDAEAKRLEIEARSRREALAARSAPANPAGSTEGVCSACGEGDDGEWVGDGRTMLMKQIVEHLLGKKVSLWDPRAIERARAEAEADAAKRDQASSAAAASGSGAPERAGFGVAYDYQETRTEVEAAAFDASGVVRTADGRTIAFEVSLDMRRESVDVTRLRFTAGDAQLTDPLVINFAGTAAELTDETYEFDLDADGTADRISFVRSGGGLLALDRNGDGIVNDGSELFGPTTGDGFAELAALDGDGNGWIDEADAAYADLSVWTKDASGADRLDGLMASNVGAIYLGAAATPFTLENAAGETRGAVAETGVYLEESGGAGTIQHVDLVT